jgi:hypothetical protein
MTTFSSSSRKNFTAIFCFHASTKTMHILALAFTGLIGSFHDDILDIVQDIRIAKIQCFWFSANEKLFNNKGGSLKAALLLKCFNYYSPR